MLALSEREWFKRVKQAHGNTYDYSDTEFKGMSVPVAIVCREHGVFTQTPRDHVYAKAGCRKCGLSKPRKYTTEKFIEEARKIHGLRYDYSRVRFESITAKVAITCKEHGTFLQSGNNHLKRKSGCPKCKAEDASKRMVGHQAVYPHARLVDIEGQEFCVNSEAECVVAALLVKKYRVVDQREAPPIKYSFRGQIHRHRPDFYLPELRRLVEVKSLWSIGASPSNLPEHTFAVCKSKARAADKAGFDYRIIVVERGRVVPLPSDWVSWSKRKVQRYVSGY